MKKISPTSLWIYDFDATSIDNVLEDLQLVKWLSENIIEEVCTAFSCSVIAKLPNKFCARRIDEWSGKPEKKIELYTFYDICE